VVQLLGAGHPNKAKEYGEKAVHIDPGSAIVRELMDKLVCFQKKYKRLE